MTDIKQIADACASRIMDRMEMCRGSAILKGDIASEIELALFEGIAASSWRYHANDCTCVACKPAPASITDLALTRVREFQMPLSEKELRAATDAVNEALKNVNWDWSARRARIVGVGAEERVEWSAVQDPRKW